MLKNLKLQLRERFERELKERERRGRDSRPPAGFHNHLIVVWDFFVLTILDIFSNSF